jgi:hypothetical protein
MLATAGQGGEQFIPTTGPDTLMTDQNSIPLKDILADERHPLHAEMKQFTDQIGRGEISLCACLGPQCGEPHCPCEMKRLGLAPSPARVAAEAEAQQKLADLVARGLFAPSAYTV